MMLIEYLILGIVQGLTEFLPVSSSAHLVILQGIFNIENRVLVSVSLHTGTLLALVLFFKGDIIGLLRNSLKSSRPEKGGSEETKTARRVIVYILIVTLVTGIIGLTGKDFFEELFSQPRRAAIMLFVTGLILLSTGKFMKGKRKFSELNARDAWIMGLAQGFAIVPGISRSGLTISSLLWRGLDKEAAFRFSFLASIPAILGALIMEIGKISSLSREQTGYLLFGFVIAFVSGLAALVLLRKLIRQARFSLFGYYCLAIAVLGWLYLA